MNAKKVMEKLQRHPILFAKEVLGVELWEKQAEIIESVFKNRRTVVKSCNSIGKSYVASVTALAFLYSHKDCIVLTTAPTGNQVFNIIWRSIRGLHGCSRVPLGGELMKQRLEISPEWYAIGFSTDNPDNARGFHSKGSKILIIADEANGMESSILDALEGNMTNNDAHLLMIGNPVNPEGKFFDAFTSTFFNKFTVSAFDTPNFKANNISTVDELEAFTYEEVEQLVCPHPYLITPTWAYIRLHEWGSDNPLFRSLVCAEFPEEAENVLIPSRIIDRAIKREFTEDENKNNRLSIGVDVAKGTGGDHSVLVAMKGFEQVDAEWTNDKDPMQLAGMAIRMLEKLNGRKKSDCFVVDDTGLGGGLVPRLREQGYNVIAVNFGSAPTKNSTTERYLNMKAQIFWQLRGLFNDNLIKILDKGKMIRHLSVMRYEIKSDGKIKMESKANLDDSPDFADAIALACHGNIIGTSVQAVESTQSTVVGNILSQKL